MTSNVGSDLILKSKELTDKIKQEIEQRLQSHFKPEFLNRIDAIVFFNKLPKEVIFDIVRIQLNDLIARLHAKNIALTVSNNAAQHVADLGYSDEFGARPLKRAIQNYIMLPVSQYILKNPQAKEVDVDLKKDQIVVK